MKKIILNFLIRYVRNKIHPDKLLDDAEVIVMDNDVADILLNKDKLNLKDDLSVSIGKHIRPFMKENDIKTLSFQNTKIKYDVNMGNLITSDAQLFSSNSGGKISNDIYLFNKIKKADKVKKVEEVLESVNISRIIYKRPWQMSGGQQQRELMWLMER